MKKFIKILSILWTVFCLIGILGNFSKYSFADWVTVVIVVSIPYVILWWIYKKFTSKEIKNELNEIPEPVLTPTYIETDHTIHKVDGTVITDKEIPYLQNIGQEETRARWMIPQHIRLIQESYKIMYETADPSTLCSRYNYILPIIEELQYFAKQGYYTDSETLEKFSSMVSKENYQKLIMRCFDRYMQKAHSELKTQTGIEKRKQKFIDFISSNVDPNILIK